MYTAGQIIVYRILAGFGTILGSPSETASLQLPASVCRLTVMQP